MTRRTTWLVLGILTLLLASGLAGWALGRAAARAGAPGTALPTETTAAARGEDAAETSASPYHASDPALLAATGRPQLIEFYHRL